MAQVVQAKCPGCQAILRIPANWIDQPIRCKSCGTVMQARPSSPALPAAPAAPPPLPPSRGAIKTPPPQKRQRSVVAPNLPKQPPASKAVKKGAPPPLPKHAVAAPVAPAAPAATFDFDGDGSGNESTTPRRRRRRGGWTGTLVLLGILLLAGGLTAAFWSRIQPMIAAIGQKLNNNGEVAEAPESKKNEPPTHPSKPPEKNPPSSTPTKGPTKAPAPPTNPKNPPSKPPVKPETPVVREGRTFPNRRALYVSIHNYLYANPIQNPNQVAGRIRGAGPGIRAFDNLVPHLNFGLKIAPQNSLLLSDMAKENPVPPMKGVIEQTVTDFLAAARPQDRVILFFVCHSAEINGKAYLVPIEGEFDNAASLIPLQWVYDQMAKCPARQRVLVLDVNRFNPGQGIERPISGPLGKGFEAQVKAPPEGVQVWASCGSGQQSLVTDGRPVGVFLDILSLGIDPPQSKPSLLAGRIQEPTDLIQLDQLHEAVAKRMNDYMSLRKLTQAPTLTGKDKDNGSLVDVKEPVPPMAKIVAPKTANAEVVKAVFEEISVPPLKVGSSDDILSRGALPPFKEEAMKKFEDKDAVNPDLKKAIVKARVSLWSLSPNSPPADIAAEVSAVKGKMGADLNLLVSYYQAPSAAEENNFKNRVADNEKRVSKLVSQMEEAMEALQEASGLVDDASPRWKANYTFIQARVQAELTLLEEYEGALGSMRKELPAIDRNLHSGWKLAARTKPNDSTAKKYDKSMRKLLDTLVSKNAGTPWEVLAKREKLTSLGLEWQASDRSE
jgi:hypothetical protein